MSNSTLPYISIEQNTLLIDIATHNVVCLLPDDRIGEAARIMAEKRISSIVVTDVDGHSLGIVTENNMLHAMQSRCPTDTLLKAVMSCPVITVPMTITCLDAYQVCMRDGIRHLVIISEDRKLFGVVSETDFRRLINLSVLAGRRQVASVMSRSVFIQSPETSLREALDLMESRQDTCVVAVEAERPVGIITERDIVRLYSGNQERTNIPIREVMSSPVLTISLESSINDAAEQMLANKVRHMVVVDYEGRMAGLLSEHDLTQTMALCLIDDKLIADGAFLHTLVNTIPDMVWLKDVNGVYLACNPRFERFFGAKEKDIIGKTDYDFIDKELADFFREYDRKVMETDLPSVNEERVIFADDGHSELLEALKTPMRDSHGKLIGVLGIARDITKRKQAEELLHLSELKYRSLIHNIPDVVWTTDKDGNTTFISDNISHILGYTPEEIYTDSDRWFRRIHPDDLPRVSEGFSDLMTENRQFNVEYRIQRKNGEWIWIHDRSVATYEKEGMRYADGVFADITERKNTEDALYFVAQRGWIDLAENFFEALVKYLGKRLGVDYVFVDRLDEDQSVAETVALYAKGSVVPNMRYSLTGTPCEKVMGRNFCYFRQGVQQLFPEDTLLVEMGAESYAGMPLWDSAGLAIGLIAVMDSKPLSNEASIIQVLKIMATRASAELERERNNAILLKREREFRTLVENMPDNVIRYDRQCRVQYVNFTLASNIAPEAQPVLGKAPVESHPGIKAVATYQRMIEKVIATGKNSEVEIEVPHFSGEMRTYHVRFVAEYDNNCKTVGLLAIGRDITDYKHAELQLRESELQYRTLADSGQALIWSAGTDKMCDYFNKVWLEFTGRSIEQESGIGWIEGVHPDDAQRCQDVYESFFERHEKFGLDYRLRRHDGEYRWIRDESSPRYNSEGEFIGYIGYCLDITERKIAEDNLSVTASVFDTSQEGILITDANNLIVDANPAFTRITGYNREEVLGLNPNLLSSGHQDKAFYAEMWQSLKQNKSWRGEIWCRRKSGEVYPELLSISVIHDNDDNVQRYVAVFSDISYLKEHEAELSRVAHYDALTNIPNRVLLADRMKQAISQSAREQNVLAVCYIDLDGFKSINDTLGHEAGDQVLVEVVNRIVHTIRGGDTVARLGGDEFVVLLELEKGEECVVTLERLLEVIALPIMVKDKPQFLTASIGVSIYPLDNEDSDALLRHADQAMYVAKQSGKNCFYIYDSEFDLRARNHNKFLKSIHNGLEFNQFELYYQPKINLHTKQLFGVEALIRWRHPKRGLLSPIEFLRPIENTELDIEIGNWVIVTALEQINRWHCAGLDIEVSINISAYHLESPGFVKNLQQQLAHYSDLPPGKLQIEILETVALNDLSIVCGIIEECRKFGVGFALDDFGTGYSSLSYLNKLPVDVLKIDQSFVRDMLEDKGDKAIVQGIIALALAFDRQVVAEGIETREHYQALLDMGCLIGQGYAIGRPMPAEELLHWRIE
jgi:diguanylate cyclase (GGDEF)-like protein/PAS domain S-box-containing protein